ncbi:hypothetical protein, partial [Streptomyces antibioticus]|uniref:hypothetical protein n=1 Tax=Streptomyces antibioticus TaxID=1890 RepID=UPI003D712B7B
GWTPLVSNLRSLSNLLDTQPANHPEPFHRPARGGRVCGVLADSGTDEVRLCLLDNADILNGLFRGSGWQPRQEVNGRKVTGLIRRLGGISSAAGCEPAVWQVLHTASKSADGLVHDRLVGLANKHREHWPGPVSTPDGRASYATKVVLALQQRGLLEPVAPLHCPGCSRVQLTSDVRSESEIASRMASDRFPETQSSSQPLISGS